MKTEVRCRRIILEKNLETRNRDYKDKQVQGCVRPVYRFIAVSTKPLLYMLLVGMLWFSLFVFGIRNLHQASYSFPTPTCLFLLRKTCRVNKYRHFVLLLLAILDVKFFRAFILGQKEGKGGGEEIQLLL